MRSVRKLGWVVLAIILILFSINNWTVVTVRIWENLLWETRLPVLVILTLLIGWLPTWLVHLAGRWRLRRRILALEAAARVPSAALTSTQLEKGQLDAVAQSGETPAD
jgi:lipopolysaccharide assembly protein A